MNEVLNNAVKDVMEKDARIDSFAQKVWSDRGEL